MNRIHFLPAFLTITCAALAADPAKLPQDPLEGPPLVTCKSYAIGDAKTGKLLWGFNENQTLKAASTTKIMCAYVVLRLAERNPAVLNETVTFSKIADDTSGSTSDIRVGEAVTVRELLYGLLLPSGNDAGVVFAEHFGPRLAPPEKPEGEPNSRTNFIAEMNRNAARLGMTQTTYHSAFGDGGDPYLTTSTRDLVMLTTQAMKMPHFGKYVNTAHHETDVRMPDGKPRHVKWDNTNTLLKIEGYDGVKTGWTTPAGHCLVASGHRGGDHLIIALLGSATTDARNADVRNLFRWAWRQLGHKD